MLIPWPGFHNKMVAHKMMLTININTILLQRQVRSLDVVRSLDAVRFSWRKKLSLNWIGNNLALHLSFP